MAQLTAVIVDPDGTARKTEIDNTLGAFRAAIGGGYIEGLFSPIASMYVDEEGLLKNMPFNYEATLFAQRFMRLQGVRLVGPALILGPVTTGGSDTSVRQSVVDYYSLED